MTVLYDKVPYEKTKNRDSWKYLCSLLQSDIGKERYQEFLTFFWEQKRKFTCVWRNIFLAIDIRIRTFLIQCYILYSAERKLNCFLSVFIAESEENIHCASRFGNFKHWTTLLLHLDVLRMFFLYLTWKNTEWTSQTYTDIIVCSTLNL